MSNKNYNNILNADGSQLLDRSRVRVLLCDNDVKSSQEVLGLLCKCSYQVTAVRTARQVIDALNAQGTDIDIILAEVDLPITKGFKMLKYIMREEDLRRIPIIMMSAKDEVSVVVKCLRLGAADYLVKPLRTNELLNLWTHMWKRRRMLGLAEKDILNHNFDNLVSDHSDTNTNSTTLFSDDTDDKKFRKSTVPETGISNYQECESNTCPAVELSLKHSSNCQPELPEYSDPAAGIISSYPKKSELKVGESSAFFTYVKPTALTNIIPRFRCIEENAASLEDLNNKEKIPVLVEQLGDDSERSHSVENGDRVIYGDSFPCGNDASDINMVKRSCPVPFQPKSMQGWNLSNEHISTFQLCSSNEAPADGSNSPSLAPGPFYISGMMNQNVMPSSSQMFQGSMHDAPKHGTQAMLPPYNTLPQCLAMPVMSSFSYYPLGMNVHRGQIPATHMWLSAPSSSLAEAKSGRVERREAALIRFRQKKKDRCFDKKIRYVNRKRLAERRPRVRGQFVRQTNDVEVDTNGHPAAVIDSDEDEDENEDMEGPVSSELGLDSSPERDASEF